MTIGEQFTIGAPPVMICLREDNTIKMPKRAIISPVDKCDAIKINKQCLNHNITYYDDALKSSYERYICLLHRRELIYIPDVGGDTEFNIKLIRDHFKVQDASLYSTKRFLSIEPEEESEELFTAMKVEEPKQETNIQEMLR